ncbi:hypothetical protein BofuT4_uP113450.1 [Botrytis cinerea T4]|uniref:Uncharacterized protein n=1 Tax=Botryotinia fuckeliana (strain T4) TaxID=999810 RepID=G2Y5A1_BOTF4|nr:hypothetical protein BofuT4_uP113450.1 [Botrytis cinerea T4]
MYKFPQHSTSDLSTNGIWNNQHVGRRKAGEMPKFANDSSVIYFLWVELSILTSTARTQRTLNEP